jgi:ornithine cyclodeaminase
VTELWRVIAGRVESRSDTRQITVFDDVGFATEDFSALRYLRARLARRGLYQEFDIIGDPDDPRDLYGMIMRAASGAGAHG